MSKIGDLVGVKLKSKSTYYSFEIIERFRDVETFLVVGSENIRSVRRTIDAKEVIKEYQEGNIVGRIISSDNDEDIENSLFKIVSVKDNYIVIPLEDSGYRTHRNYMDILLTENLDYGIICRIIVPPLIRNCFTDERLYELVSNYQNNISNKNIIRDIKARLEALSSILGHISYEKLISETEKAAFFMQNYCNSDNMIDLDKIPDEIKGYAIFPFKENGKLRLGNQVTNSEKPNLLNWLYTRYQSVPIRQPIYPGDLVQKKLNSGVSFYFETERTGRVLKFSNYKFKIKGNAVKGSTFSLDSNSNLLNLNVFLEEEQTPVNKIVSLPGSSNIKKGKNVFTIMLSKSENYVLLYFIKIPDDYLIDYIIKPKADQLWQEFNASEENNLSVKMLASRKVYERIYNSNNELILEALPTEFKELIVLDNDYVNASWIYDSDVQMSANLNPKQLILDANPPLEDSKKGFNSNNKKYINLRKSIFGENNENRSISTFDNPVKSTHSGMTEIIENTPKYGVVMSTSLISQNTKSDDYEGNYTEYSAYDSDIIKKLSKNQLIIYKRLVEELPKIAKEENLSLPIQVLSEIQHGNTNVDDLVSYCKSYFWIKQNNYADDTIANTISKRDSLIKINDNLFVREQISKIGDYLLSKLQDPNFTPEIREKELGNDYLQVLCDISGLHDISSVTFQYGTYSNTNPDISLIVESSDGKRVKCFAGTIAYNILMERIKKIKTDNGNYNVWQVNVITGSTILTEGVDCENKLNELLLEIETNNTCQYIPGEITNDINNIKK